MKILLVGVHHNRAPDAGMVDSFKRCGAEATLYTYQTRRTDIERDCHRLSGYDLYFMPKNRVITIDILRIFKKHGKVFYWYRLPLWAGFDELQELFISADYVGVGKWEVFERARMLNPNTHFLIEGFDPACDYPVECEKIYDVSFIGDPYGDRKQWLDAIDGVTIIQGKYNTEHARAVGQSRINLNFTGGGGPSDRVYKILAAGGFLLSEEWSNAEKYKLAPGRDYITFKSIAELKDKIEYYLEHPEERERIARQGCESVQPLSRDNLAKQIVEIVS